MKSIHLFFLVIIICFSSLDLYAQNMARPDVPDWVDQAVFYQIYPQTYKDTDGDGIGDLEGIIDKLEYIKSLGINALWLSPFYESPFCDAGYDVADFYKVDSRYGTNETAKKLFEKAEELGIKVILDFVVGHTSIENEWFKASGNKDPKYKNWFIWTNSTWITPEEYAGKFIQGYANRNASYMTNFFWCQPKLNYGFSEEEIKYDWQLPIDHPDVMALKTEMKNVLKFWLEMGASGFRVDMAGSAGKDFWRDVRSWFDDDYPQAFLISEWGDPAEAIDAGFHADFMHWYRGYDDLYHKKWFMRFMDNPDQYSAFFEAEGKGDITVFLDSFLDQHGKLKKDGYISIPVDNHDMIRIKNGDRIDKDLEIIYAFQMTFPSIPFLYYGDEVGMRQLPLFDSLAVEGSYGTRSGNRTPMQWDDSKNLGFSSAESEYLYLPVDWEDNAPTVSAYESDNESLIYKTRKLIEIRKKEKALAPHASMDLLYAKKNEYPLIYTRELDGETILVVLNPSKDPISVEIAFEGANKLTPLMQSGVKVYTKKGFTQVKCDGRSYGIFKK